MAKYEYTMCLTYNSAEYCDQLFGLSAERNGEETAKAANSHRRSSSSSLDRFVRPKRVQTQAKAEPKATNEGLEEKNLI